MVIVHYSLLIVYCSLVSFSIKLKPFIFNCFRRETIKLQLKKQLHKNKISYDKRD